MNWGLAGPCFGFSSKLLPLLHTMVRSRNFQISPEISGSPQSISTNIQDLFSEEVPLPAEETGREPSFQDRS